MKFYTFLSSFLILFLSFSCVSNCYKLNRYLNRNHNYKRNNNYNNDEKLNYRHNREAYEAKVERLSSGQQNNDDNNMKDGSCRIEIRTIGCSMSGHKATSDFSGFFVDFQKNFKNDRLKLNDSSSSSSSSSSSLSSPSPISQVPISTSPEDEEPNRNSVSSREDIKEAELVQQRILNTFMDRLMVIWKKDFGSRFDPLKIKMIQLVELKHWGNATIYDLKIHGLRQIKPNGIKLIATDKNQWRFKAAFQARDLKAFFKVDAHLDQSRILIKNWILKLLIENCNFKAVFMFDFDILQLKIDSLQITGFKNFRLATDEPLSWPFNTIVREVITREKNFLREVIEMNAQKYINRFMNNGTLNLKDILQDS